MALFGSGVLDPELSVPLLHRDDMQMSRDLVDLAMIDQGLGPDTCDGPEKG